METFTHRPVRGLFSVSLLICTAFLVTSCAKKILFNHSVAVPAAEGYVKVNRDKNKNYSLDIRVKNLASPQRLSPPRETYIVWIETDNGNKNIGQLSSSSSLFSSSLKASLKTVTAFKPTRLLITAEEKGDVRYPGAQPVLTTEPFKVH